MKPATAIPKHHHWLTDKRRSAIVALAIISVSLAAGVVGYHFIGGLSWMDALLEASMILGGEGPIAPMKSDAVKLFASIYALYSGLMLLTTTGLLLAQWIHALVYHSHMKAQADAKKSTKT